MGLAEQVGFAQRTQRKKGDAERAKLVNWHRNLNWHRNFTSVVETSVIIKVGNKAAVTD